MKEASSDKRKAASFATSTGCPRRFRACSAAHSAILASGLSGLKDLALARRSGVSMAPGELGRYRSLGELADHLLERLRA